MRIIRWLRFVGIGVGTFAMLLLLPTQAVFADKCNPGRTPSLGNWESFWQRLPSNTVGGTYADIKILDPYVNSAYGDGGNTVAWVGILNAAGNSACGGVCDYAQLGWQQYPYNNGTSEMDTFYEWGDANGNITVSSKFECALHGNVGDIKTYTVLWGNAGTGKLSFSYAGGYTCGGHPVAGWTPDAAVQGAEILNLASQMPGGKTSGYHESFSGSNIYYSGSWSNFNGSGHLYPVTGYGNEFAYSVDDSDYFSAWDKECQY